MSDDPLTLWLAHRREIIRRARQRASQLGADCELSWHIESLATELELETIMLSGCERFLIVP